MKAVQIHALSKEGLHYQGNCRVRDEPVTADKTPQTYITERHLIIVTMKCCCHYQ